MTPEIGDNPELMFSIYESCDLVYDRIRVAEEYLEKSKDIWTVIYARSDPDRTYDDSVQIAEVLEKSTEKIAADDPEGTLVKEKFINGVNNYVSLCNVLRYLGTKSPSELDETEASILEHRSEHLELAYSDFLKVLNIDETLKISVQAQETIAWFRHKVESGHVLFFRRRDSGEELPDKLANFEKNFNSSFAL